MYCIIKIVILQTLVAIKALGNIGVAPSVKNPTLQLCIEDKQLPMEVRIAAVEAHRCRTLLVYFYLNKTPLVTKTEWDIIMTLNIAHWSHFGIVIFSIILTHIDVFVTLWHKFKNSVVVWIRLLHSQSFMASHCYFLVILESVTSQMLLQWPNKWSVVKYHPSA